MSSVDTNNLTAALLVQISERWQPCLVFRVNVVVARYERAVRSAPNGTADILGVIRGRAVAIEVKAGKDRMREAQKNFREQWIASGGIHIIAKTLEQALADLQAAVEQHHARRTP